MEDSNRVLIHNFRAQLAQQLASLHTTVDASVKEQEKKLKVVEEETQLFVSTKAQVKIPILLVICQLNLVSGCIWIEDLDNEKE